MTDKKLKTIKSFVLRGGRMSPRQTLGLTRWLPEYRLTLGAEPWDFAASFGRVADVVVDLGFGMGQSLVAMAKAAPELNFVGIEVHQAGIGTLAADLHDEAVTNVRIAPYDAVDVLRQGIAGGALAGITIFFPDPWPKVRHHKRRLIQPEFVRLVVEKIRPGGIIHLATDWQDYAMQMLQVLSSDPNLSNQDPGGAFISRPASRPMTKFEQRGINLGHEVWDLQFKHKIVVAQKL